MSAKLLFVVFLCLFGSVSASWKDNPLSDDFKVQITASFVGRILQESSSIPIETFSLAGTNESFFQAVIDRLTTRFGKLMCPIFNNALPWHAPTRQLVIMAADDVGTLMSAFVQAFRRQQPNFLTRHNRDIYILLLVSDIRFLSGSIVNLLKEGFSSANFVVVAPPPFPFQPPLLVAVNYLNRIVILPSNNSMQQMFSDRFQANQYPLLKLAGFGLTMRIRMNGDGVPAGYDWNVFHTIMEHMKLRWTLTVYDNMSSLELLRWFNHELDKGTIDIMIDRSFRSDLRSVQYILPEMNGVCLVVPKTEKFNVLQHLLRPFASTAWIMLIVALLVGACLAERHFRHSLLATLIFGVDLDASNVSRKERIILFGSLVIFFILSEAYQAKLLALMSSSRYPPDPKTVSEFLQTDTMLYVGDATATYLSYNPSLQGRVQNATNYFFSFYGGTDYGSLMHCPVAWEFFYRWIRKQYEQYGYNMRPRMHIVGEKILSLPASFTFSRMFFLYPRFKLYLDRIFESGLMGYWETEHNRREMFNQKFEFVENEIITFNDLIMVWIVLGIGNGLAFLTFLMELLHFHLTKWQARKPQRLFVKSKQYRKLFRSK